MHATSKSPSLRAAVSSAAAASLAASSSSRPTQRSKKPLRSARPPYSAGHARRCPTSKTRPYAVRVLRCEEVLACRGRRGGLGAGEEGGPHPRAGRAGREHGSQAARRPDAPGGENRDLDGVEDVLQQRQRGYLATAMTATLAIAGDDHVYTGLLGSNGLPLSADLSRRPCRGLWTGTRLRTGAGAGHGSSGSGGPAAAQEWPFGV